MKLYPFALTALLAMTVVSATRLTTHTPRSRASAPVTIAVGVTPRRLNPLDTATIAATFSTAGSEGGPYTTILQLRPRGGGHGPTASQGGFRLRPELYEFWQHREDRLHDRFRYRARGDGGWVVERLAP